MRAHRIISGIAPFALLSFAISQVAPAAVFESDNRQTPPISGDSPYAPIGVVRASYLGKYTTGFLVDPCDVLTAQHLFGNRHSPLGRRVHFTAGFSTRNRVRSDGTVIAAGGYDTRPKYSRHMAIRDYDYSENADWALIRLDVCVGQQLGYVRLARDLPFETPVESAGFPSVGFLRDDLKLDPSCRIRAQNALVWRNDCAALPGNSGSPIFREKREGTRVVLKVYAMQTAGFATGKTVYPFALSYANVAVPVATILPAIEPLLKHDSEAAAPLQTALAK